MKHFSDDSEIDYSYDEAIEIAKEYGLDEEVKHDMCHNDYSPNQALKEWDIYPYRDDFNEGTIRHFQD